MSNTDFPPCRWQRPTNRVHIYTCECPLPAAALGRKYVDPDDCAACPVREERSPRERILARLAEVTYLGRTYNDVVRLIVNEELPE